MKLARPFSFFAIACFLRLDRGQYKRPINVFRLNIRQAIASPWPGSSQHNLQHQCLPIHYPVLVLIIQVSLASFVT